MVRARVGLRSVTLAMGMEGSGWRTTATFTGKRLKVGTGRSSMRFGCGRGIEVVCVLTERERERALAAVLSWLSQKVSGTSGPSVTRNIKIN